MDKNILHIKNMVCGRCILTVESILLKLGLQADHIALGEVILMECLPLEKRNLLEKELLAVGFELILERNEKLTNKIRSVIIDNIYGDKSYKNQNLSVILARELHMDYSHISSFFSRVEGKSIQQFQQEIKTERVKELLEYDELTISEIAVDLGYSSAAYLSTQFKKSTGLTPSEYKGLHHSRNALDKL